MSQSDDLRKLIAEVVRDVLEETGATAQAEPATTYGADGDDLRNRVLMPCEKQRAALEKMRQSTPARIGVWRAGARYKTESYLKARADHAVARDAVLISLDKAKIEQLGILYVDSAAANKTEFLINPSLGRRLSDVSAESVKANCPSETDVQIVICDGLSSAAIELNIASFLPALMNNLQGKGLKLGKPIYVNNGRVAVQDQIGDILRPRIALSIVGERPGLVTAESMGCYITYNPSSERVEAERTMISNIHKGGLHPQKAAVEIAEKTRKIFDQKASGMGFKE